MWLSYLFAGVCGLGFGLLQAKWTGNLVQSAHKSSRMIVMTLVKLLSWLVLMAALALYNITALIVFMISAGMGMVGFSIYLWRKSLKEPEFLQSKPENQQEVAP